MAQGMPPQAGPQGGGGQPPPKQGGGAGGFGSLVSQTFNGLADMSQVLESASAPPKALEMIRKMQTDFQGLIELLQGGGDDGGEEMTPKGPADAMAGPGGGMPMP